MNPTSYALSPGEVHVWKIPLASTSPAVAHLRGILSPFEIDRAAHCVFEQDQARFISCRASMRCLLSRYTGVAPEKIVFRYEPKGKPALAGIGGWQFNLSHSRSLAALAISRYDPVGIDLERIDPDFPRNDVAPDILAADELADLCALPPDMQPLHFFQLWTLKEALLKSGGAGFSLDAHKIRIRVDAALHPAIISAPADLRHATLNLLSLEEGYASALAVLGPVSGLSFFTY